MEVFALERECDEHQNDSCCSNVVCHVATSLSALSLSTQPLHLASALSLT